MIGDTGRSSSGSASEGRLLIWKGRKRQTKNLKILLFNAASKRPKLLCILNTTTYSESEWTDVLHTCLKNGWPMRAVADGLKSKKKREKKSVFRTRHFPSPPKRRVNVKGPFFCVSLQTELNEGVEVRGEGAVVRVCARRRRGRGLPVGVANASGRRALADARVCPGARRLHRQLLWRDGGGVQQTRHCPI